MKKLRHLVSLLFLVMGMLLYVWIAQAVGSTQAWLGDTSPATGRRLSPGRKSISLARPNASRGVERETNVLPAADRATFASTAVTHTFTADADTEVSSADRDTNYGGETTMMVGNDYSSNHYRAYAHFDLSAIPDGAVVQTATLRLHVYTVYGGQAFDVKIYRPQAAWDEYALTWNTQPVSTATGITTTVDSIDYWFDWDVTSPVQDWAAGGDNYGLALRAVDEASPSLDSANVFDTREGTEPPQLVITYTLPNLSVDTFGYAGEVITRGVESGDQLSLHISNDGAAPVSESYFIGLYVSDDDEITTGDRLLTGGRLTGPSLGAGESVTVTVLGLVRVPDDYAPGQAHLGVILDEMGDISESDEGDNTAAESVFVLPSGAYTWTVDTISDDSVPVSLRYALTYARAGDTIQFDPAVFPPGAPATIQPATALPQIGQGDLTIGGSDSGVILDGSLLPAGTDGLVLASDVNTVTGLWIQDMPSDGIFVSGDDNVIGGGVAAVARAAADEVAGPPATPANLIGGNGGHGISIQGSGNVVRSNWIGTNATGAEADANGRDGIYVSSDAQNNQVGGSAAGQGNLISGNAQAGIEVEGENTSENRIEGNHIGTGVKGTDAIPNQSAGVQIHSYASHNCVGGGDPSEGNLISANDGEGIYIGGTDHITVAGNLIGTDINGAQSLPNRGGIHIYGASDNLIGGGTSSTGDGCSAPCNLISGNYSDGILIDGQGVLETHDNDVVGNFIGVDKDGGSALANRHSGVYLGDNAHDNQIGGSKEGKGNVISGNEGAGVLLSGQGVEFNLVLGNIIGLDASAAGVVGNQYGVQLKNGPWLNWIGGTGLGEPNVIAGNDSHGVYLLGSETQSNHVRRNYIGTNDGLLGYVGNGGDGVYVDGASKNVIGVPDSVGNDIVNNAGDGVAISAANENQVTGNRIGIWATDSGNGGHGVYVYNNSPDNEISENSIAVNSGDGVRVEGSGSLRNTISHNNIYGNGGAGIENLDGGNTELAPPQWTGYRTGGGDWRIEGTTCPNCTVEIFSDSVDEGEYLEASVQADAGGSFTAEDVSRRALNFLLTATDTDGNTSEFGDTTMNVAVDDTGALEITQAIQDRNNSVLLIENKPTFVRFHVHANQAGESVSARLTGSRGGVVLGHVLPNNSGQTILTRADPDRGQLDEGFWFELPSAWLTGTLTLRAEVNHEHRWIEVDYADNIDSETVTFQYSPPMKLTVFDACYTVGGTTHRTSVTHTHKLASWLRRAYPISELVLRWGTLTPCFNGQPSAGQVNDRLMLGKAFNIANHNEDPYKRYYGMIDDTAAFTRGQAVDIPSTVATGPAGAPGAGHWDTDGSYADWYGGHELGHTYGRVHTWGITQTLPGGGWRAPCGNCATKACGPWSTCGCEGGAQSVYTDGFISPGQDEDAANTLYGFDIRDHTVYGPDWKDVMSYCDNQWITDVTYEGIHTQMISETQGAASTVRPQSTAEYLAILGSVITATDQVTLEHFYRISDAWGWLERIPGDYSIRLLDSGGGTLADYPFTPRFSHVDPGAGCQSAETGSEADPALIAEFVPWVDGTAEIGIFHNSTKIAFRAVSSHPPTVTVQSPNGGESLAGTTTTLSWSAGDDDGDDLDFTIQYSVDGGSSWRVLSPGMTERSAVISTSLLAGTTQGRIRVVASDGVNTSHDDSDGDFSVPFKSPELQLIAPQSFASYEYGQTVGFQAEAYDVEDGSLSGEVITWTSSISGTLGTGRHLALADLITGTHTITVTATDSDGQKAQATTEVVVGGTVETIYLPVVLRHLVND